MITHNRFGLTLLGVLLLGLGAIAAEGAWLHMAWLARTYGRVCGQAGFAHCPACPATLALIGSGLALLAAASAGRHAARAVS
jgi:hypothetical protein